MVNAGPLPDGGWSDWSPFTGCSVSCDGGFQVRLRECTNPPPTGTGKKCEGLAVEIQSCNTNDCEGNRVERYYQSGGQ